MNRYNKYDYCQISDDKFLTAHANGRCNSCAPPPCGQQSYPPQPPCPPPPCPPPCPPPVDTPKSIADCCCAHTIRTALQMLQNTVYETAIPGFSVLAQITTTTGITYPVVFSYSSANPIVIGPEILTYGNVAISLCDIVKIDIQTSQVASTEFLSKLAAALKRVTTTRCGCGCSGPPLTNCSCGSDNCCCTEGMQQYAKSHQATITAVNYPGSMQTIQSISAITTIVDTTVVNNVVLQPINTPVVADASAVVSATTVVTGVATVPLSVLTYANAQPQTVLSNVTVSSVPAAAPFAVTPTTVITGVTTVPSNFLAVTATTSTLAAAPFGVTATTLVSAVSTIPSVVLSNVTNTSAAAAAPFAVTPTTVITSVSSTTAQTPLVSTIATVPQTVVNHLTTVPATVNTGYPNPVVVDGVLSGLTHAVSVTTQQAILPSLTAAPGGLFVNVNGATIPVVDANGNAVVIGSSTTIYVLGSATNLLGGLVAAPVITDNVLTDLGVPTTAQVLSNVVTTTVAALANVTATTVPANYYNTSTSASINPVTAAPATVTVVGSIATVPQTISSPGTVSLQSVNVVNTAPTSVSVINGLTTLPQSINSVSAVTQSVVNAVNAPPASVTVVNNIVTVPQATYSYGTLAPVTLVQIAGVNTATVVNAVTLSKTTTPVVSSVSAVPQFITVTQAVEANTINVFAPVTHPIGGTVEDVGGGIMVVSMPNNDISLLSLCDVESIETQ